MARAELIPRMTEEQLDRNEAYARERIENNPEQTFGKRLIELLQIQRKYNNDVLHEEEYNRDFAAKLEEYREAVGREVAAPVIPHR